MAGSVGKAVKASLTAGRWSGGSHVGALHPVSCCQTQHLLQAMSAYPSHRFSIIVPDVHYTVQLMSILNFWCFPSVQSGLGLVIHVLMTVSPFLSENSMSTWTLWCLLPGPCGPTMFPLYLPLTKLFKPPTLMMFVFCHPLQLAKYLMILPLEITWKLL